MYTPALLLGLAGSLHCVGMCGPLMVALHGPSGQQSWVGMVLYQLGRIITYSAIGLFLGLAGKGLALAGLQQILSIVAGIFMVAFALFAWRMERWLHQIPAMQFFVQHLQKRLSATLQHHSTASSFTFGMLNGLLPCGMVYAALAGAIAMTGPMEGALFMFFFGTGTAPLMLVSGILGSAVSGRIRRKFQLIQPMLLLVSGFLLVQKGLHLDLSLFDAAVPPAELDCH